MLFDQACSQLYILAKPVRQVPPSKWGLRKAKVQRFLVELFL